MSRTKQPDYDVKPDFGNLLTKHRQLPFKRFIDAISAKFADINDILNEPAPADQYPGKIIPYALPLLYGPLPRVLATAPPPEPVIARNGNALINREFTFEVQSLSAYGFINVGWLYDAFPKDPEFGGPYVPPRVGPLGDILDSATEMNGGAMPLDFFGSTFDLFGRGFVGPPLIGNFAFANISFDVELYDRLRGRRLHEGRLPVEIFQGGRLAHRKMASPILFEKGSNVEPRLYLNEIEPFSPSLFAEWNIPEDSLALKAYVILVLKGRQYVEVPGV